eukprot:1160663-Pelagomonas_calceolata.AAC.6
MCNGGRGSSFLGVLVHNCASAPALLYFTAKTMCNGGLGSSFLGVLVHNCEPAGCAQYVSHSRDRTGY